MSEHHLRLLEKQGQLPGIRTGNRFKVNVDLLVEQLDRESAANVTGFRPVENQAGAAVV